MQHKRGMNQHLSTPLSRYLKPAPERNPQSPTNAEEEADEGLCSDLMSQIGTAQNYPDFG